MECRQWLVELRTKSNKSTYTVAKELKMSQSLYSHYETGRRNPSIKTAKKIAQYFGFDWTMFFEEREKAV